MFKHHTGSEKSFETIVQDWVERSNLKRIVTLLHQHRREMKQSNIIWCLTFHTEVKSSYELFDETFHNPGRWIACMCSRTLLKWFRKYLLKTWWIFQTQEGWYWMRTSTTKPSWGVPSLIFFPKKRKRFPRLSYLDADLILGFPWSTYIK